MKARDIKTIDVHCKEWFDKVNGNSYFAGEVIVNAGKENEKRIVLPFQYGYGDSYKHEAFEAIKKELKCFKGLVSPWRTYGVYNINATHSKKEYCLKRDLMEYKN